jgi:murein DD-endopeptidase MepM/ murein hydrolase activator NlpD
MTRREAKALWEAEQKAAAKQTKMASKIAAAQVVQAPQAIEAPKGIEALSAVDTPTVVEPVETSATVTEDISPRSSSKPQLMATLKSRTPKLLKAPKTGKLARASKPELSPRQRTARVTTMVAMAFVAGLAVATTVPANALLSASEVRAMNAGTTIYAEDGQDLQASDGAVASGRDKVSALQWGGVMGGGLYSKVSFVNNPLGKIQYPIRQSCPISDMYGLRPNPWGSGSEFHHGIDFNPGEGFPIQSIADGVVTVVSNGDSSNYGALGYFVTVTHQINGHKVESTYAHMLAGSIQVKLGQKVHVTDILGLVGSTGASTGAHLHFQLVVDSVMVDPWPWLQANAK